MANPPYPDYQVSQSVKRSMLFWGLANTSLHFFRPLVEDGPCFAFRLGCASFREAGRSSTEIPSSSPSSSGSSTSLPEASTHAW